MNEDFDDYNVRLARYIWTILKSQPIIIWSWGIDPKTVRTIELGLEFYCQGFKHRGLVRVILNEGEDLFEVTLISEDGETLKTIEHIFVDNLISVIDDAVEKCENYQERISQEYGIITKTELCENDTSPTIP